MSRLYYSDTGRTVHLLNEELSSRRHIRKELLLDGETSGGGTLYILARQHYGHHGPLQGHINGHTFQLAPGKENMLHWYTVPLSAEMLQAGVNTVELWADTPAMDGWILGLDPTVENTGSALSPDGGLTWRTSRMGIHHALSGEYIVRIRLNGQSATTGDSPEITWEDPSCSALADLRDVLPAGIHGIDDAWARARRLCSWVSTQWYCEASETKEYCPWDPLTILAWKRTDFGQHVSDPTAYCVHYSVVFIGCALALGIPARAICGTLTLPDFDDGHFIAEVWIKKWQKWCALDPRCDFVFILDGVPLSVAEIRAHDPDVIRATCQCGPGHFRLPAAERESNLASSGAEEKFTHWAVWPRNDFLSSPHETPPSHGNCVYAETDWLWADNGDAEALGMFPHHFPVEALRLPPPKPWRT